jgi:chromosome segregation ATPase
MVMEHRVDRLEDEVIVLKTEMSDVKTRLAVAESNIKDIKETLSSIKSNTTWIIRLVLGAIVMAILGFIIQNGGK